MSLNKNISEATAFDQPATTTTVETSVSTTSSSLTAANQSDKNRSTILANAEPLNAMGPEVFASIFKNGNGKLTPVALGKLLMTRFIFAVIHSDLCVFNGAYYVKLTRDTLATLIDAHLAPIMNILGSVSPVKDAYDYLLIKEELQIPKECLPHHLVCVKNGVFNPFTLTLQQHTPDLYFSSCLEANIDFNAACPTFDAFLEDVSHGDEALKLLIYEVIGYILVPLSEGYTNEKYLFLFQGKRNSGKSVLVRFPQQILGPEQCIALEPNAMTRQFAGGNTYGKVLCTAMDLPSSPLSSDAIGRLKTYTGGDLISEDIKYRELKTFYNVCKFVYGMNGPLYLSYNDAAFLSRLIVIPFYWEAEHKDPSLAEKLWQERDGIVTKALYCYHKMMQRGSFIHQYPLNDAVENNYASPEDPLIAITLTECITRFVNESCTIASGVKALNADLYQAFISCDYSPYHPSQAQFTKELKKVLDAVCPGQVTIARWRKAPNCNPQYGLIGISLRTV